jgi:uncharacterized protein YcbX
MGRVPMELVALSRYPVKSMQGERLDRARVEDNGIVGDRRWGLRDQRTGRILTARRRPELLEAAASYEQDLPIISLPGGGLAEGPGRRTDRLLSDWLGHPVSLVSSVGGDPGRAKFFSDATDDSSQAFEWTMPASQFVDAAPLLVLTSASLRTAEGLHPDGVWDPRRFRPNLLIDLGGDGWVEDRWIGQPLRVGTVTLVATERCIRCTMVTRAQPGLTADVDIFRSLARHHGGRFGVWSNVLNVGNLSLGDTAFLMATNSTKGSPADRID